MAIERKLIYIDLWDTVRTRDHDGEHREIRAQYIGTAHMIMALLRGHGVVLSQTHGFDSALVLGSANLGGTGAVHFRNLVKDGYIRFHLYSYPDLIQAFKGALLDDDYIFSAWPELHRGEVDRQAVLEALQGRSPLTLPANVKQRLETFFELDSANRKAGHGAAAGPPKKRLLDLLKEITANQQVDRFESAGLLRELSSCDSNKRSFLYRKIDSYSIPSAPFATDAYAQKIVGLKNEARQVVDMCYNSSISESIGADISLLSAEKDSSVELARSTIFPGSDLCAISELELPSAVTAVGWEELSGFLSQVKELPFSKVEAEAEAAKLLTIKAIEGNKIFAILPKLPGKLLHGLGAGALGFGLAYLADPTVLVGIATIASPAIRSFGRYKKDNKKIKQLLEEKLIRRFLGLLQKNQ